MRLINELRDYQCQANDCPIFYGGLAELHVYTGKSDDVVLEEKTQKKTSRELVKGGLPPLELLADHSMQFYRDDTLITSPHASSTYTYPKIQALHLPPGL